MGHNISTSIEMDYTNLGTLKSHSFSSCNLKKFYIYQYMTAEVIGSSVAVAMSIAVIAPIVLMSLAFCICSYLISRKIKKVDIRMLIVE